MLTNLELDELKASLISRRDELSSVQNSGREATEVVELDQSRVGRLSRMDALQGQAMAKESERRRALEQRKIEAALSRLESGDFGYCLRCDELIAIERLRIDPGAPLCIACADKPA